MAGHEGNGEVERVDIEEAARRLNTTTDALRKKLRRGTLTGEKVDGHWYVWLNGHATAGRASASEIAIYERMIDTLQREVDFLRQELQQEQEARTEESRRRDIIIAQLTEQMRSLPEVVAGECPAQTMSSVPDGPERTPEPQHEPPVMMHMYRPPEPAHRSWWAFWRREP